MALHFFDCKGYGQIEPSQVWFNRAGMVEAQCALDSNVFASNFPVTPAEVNAGKIVAENGAFLMVDKERKIATIPTKALSDLGFKMGINYSTERLYNQYTPGRRNFCMIAGEYLPRIGFIEPGMRICTNAVAWDDTADFLADASAEDKVTSDGVWAAVRDYIANLRDPANGRKNTITPPASPATDASTTVTSNPATAPIYCGVTDKSLGKLVLGIDPADAIGGVLGIVTAAYYNADNTDAFKILFIDPNQVA